jgi:hypothetical protein
MTDEQDEFDEELIDDDGEDADAYDEEGDDDDTEDEFEEDEFVEVRTAVLQKREMLALISVKTGAAGGVMVRVDPREPRPSAQTYDDPAAALRWFRRSLATSRQNGWQIVYEGAPLAG